MPSDLGTFIRQHRSAAGIGLRELARRVGRSAPFLSQLELDDNPPAASEETLTAIADALNVSADELFAKASKLPRALAPESALEVALYRRMKAMSPALQEEYLKMLEKQDARGRSR